MMLDSSARNVLTAMSIDEAYKYDTRRCTFDSHIDDGSCARSQERASALSLTIGMRKFRLAAVVARPSPEHHCSTAEPSAGSPRTTVGMPTTGS